jgi:hypothetical protein
MKSDRLYMAAHISVPFLLAAGGALLVGAALPALGVAGMVAGGLVGAFAGTAHCVGRLFLSWSHCSPAARYPSIKGYAAAIVVTGDMLLSMTGLKKAFNAISRKKAQQAQPPKPAENTAEKLPQP